VSGRIVLVGTPIGNLGDLSPRAVAALRSADVIACEDTRVTRKLLTHAQITGKRLIALHAHNEAKVASQLVDLATSGATVAVVSDAGLPLISDPGDRVMAAALAAGVAVEVVPGPSAVLTALMLSGLPADRFSFEGFLPRKGGERVARLAAIAADPRTVVVFDSPHRVAETVAALATACGGDRPVAVLRELTKMHEEVWRGTLEGAKAWLSGVSPRGEYVVVVGGAPAAAPATDLDVQAALVARLEAGLDRKTAIAEVAAGLGVPKRSAYEIALQLRPPPAGEGS
jgi:16S rRNA (cytidine1402-2'-O)-methyltransferase